MGTLICRYCRLDLRAGTRVALALALVLVPHGGEVFLTQAALQWFLAPLLLLLIVQRPAVSRGQPVQGGTVWHTATGSSCPPPAVTRTPG